MDKTALARLIPARAKRVVDLGKPAEWLAVEFSSLQPAVEYIGITDEPLTPATYPNVTKTVSTDIDTLDLATYSLSDIDCLLYQSSTLTTHIAILSALLEKHKNYLNDKGQMLFVIDNALVTGMIGTADNAGMLQTQEQIITKIELAGVCVKDISIVNTLSANNADNDKLYIIRAVKQPVPESEKILIHVTGAIEEVCAPIRIEAPHRFLHNEAEVIVADTPDTLPFGISVYLLHRLALPPERGRLEALNALACRGLLLHEIDDLPIQEKVKATRYFGFVATHALQTSTPYLANWLRDNVNPYVVVFRNQLKSLPPPREFRNNDRVTVFFGAINRRADWQELMPVLNELSTVYGDKLYFKVVADREFYHALRTNYKEYIGNTDGGIVPPVRYHEELHKADINLLPLLDNEFNRSKSELKYLETAGHGVVALASPTVYQDTIEDGVTGIIYHSPREFAEYLKVLIENADIRQAIGENGYNYVKRHRLLSQHYTERIDAYRELWARRTELETARLKRIADLFPELNN